MLLSQAVAAGSGAISPTSSGSWGLLITFFCIAIGCSFFCSLWEAVILSVTNPYIAHLKKTHPRAGERLETLKDRIGRPLTAILTVNTLANTAGSMAVAAQVTALGGGKWDAAAGAFMTCAVLFAAEIIPKNLGARYWRTWAPWVSFCVQALTKVMTPIVWFIEMFMKGQQNEVNFSRDELRVMAEIGTRQGKLKEDQSRILENLLQLGDIAVREVMTPRTVVFALPEDMTVQMYLDRHNSSPFSRIPLYHENRDDIKGFVLKHDILLSAAQGKLKIKLGALQRDISVIPSTTKLTDAFQDLVANRHHAAIVIDEYGGMSGLVTMEDIVETLLGLEIVDEADTRDDMQEFARNLWKARATKMGLMATPASPVEVESPVEKVN